MTYTDAEFERLVWKLDDTSDESRAICERIIADRNRLKAEVERLNLALSENDERHASLRTLCANQQAEVERLKREQRIIDLQYAPCSCYSRYGSDGIETHICKRCKELDSLSGKR